MALVEACIRFLDVLNLKIEFGVKNVVKHYKSDTDQSRTSLYVFGFVNRTKDHYIVMLLSVQIFLHNTHSLQISLINLGKKHPKTWKLQWNPKIRFLSNGVSKLKGWKFNKSIWVLKDETSWIRKQLYFIHYTHHYAHNYQ